MQLNRFQCDKLNRAALLANKAGPAGPGRVLAVSTGKSLSMVPDIDNHLQKSDRNKDRNKNHRPGNAVRVAKCHFHDGVYQDVAYGSTSYVTV